MSKQKKPELLAPAGDMEKLKIAVAYGADAVYMGGSQFGLRAKAKNFDLREMHQAVTYAHERNVKVYITANIFAHNDDLEGMKDYFAQVAETGADALIVSDPGVFVLAAESGMDIHISTQANTTNYQSVLFWQMMGAKRVVLARELSLGEITEIKKRCPDDFQLEAFVHGAMCVAYSGRCLLSHYLTGRSANRGLCAHPCRYQYYLVESTRPGQYLPINEDERSVTLLSSKDLCMVEHIPELLAAGLNSFKIEGRMKTPFYVGTAVKAYRQAIDDWFNDPALYERRKPYYMAGLQKASHRGGTETDESNGFTSGFYFGEPGADAQTYTESSYSRTHEFLGIVLDYDARTGMAAVEQRNKFEVGDIIEFITAHGDGFSQTLSAMWNDSGESITSAPHARQLVRIVAAQPVKPLDMICRAVE